MPLLTSGRIAAPQFRNVPSVIKLARAELNAHWIIAMHLCDNGFDMQTHAYKLVQVCTPTWQSDCGICDQLWRTQRDLHVTLFHFRNTFFAIASNELFKDVTCSIDSFHFHHLHNYAYECMRSSARSDLTLQIRFVDGDAEK